MLATCVGTAGAQQQVVLFSDDFEHGAASWQLDPGWKVALAEANHVLVGEGRSWAQVINGEQLGDIRSFRFQFSLEAGNVQVNYRMNGQTRTSRYWVSIQEGGLTLVKMVARPGAPAGTDPFDVIMLASCSAPISFAEWHRFEITGQGGQLDVFLDEQQMLTYNDRDNPHLNGTVAFASMDGSRIVVDDVVLKGYPPTGPIWVATGGPRGGIGYDVRIHPTSPSIMWVTDANAGVHKSTDGGHTWAPHNEGITARSGPSGDGIPIFSLNLDPSDPNTLWAGTLGMRGVFKSADGGVNWVQREQGIATQTSMEMRSFTVDPKDSNTAYCGGNYMADATTLKQRGFIYKTVDGGKSWKLLTEPGALVRWIIVDPTDSRVVYAATGIFDRFATKAEGILKSTDGGATWRNINTGLISLAVGALAMDPTNPRTLIAGCGKGAATFQDDPNDLFGGVFKTTDAGEHWRQVDPFGASSRTQVSAVAYAPSSPKIVYADRGNIFMRSEDGGDTWEFFPAQTNSENRGTPISLAVHPSNPDVVYMNGYDGGVFLSVDRGHTWSDASAGYTGSQSWAIAIDPSDAGHLVVGSKNGIHESSDAGQTWRGRLTDGEVNNMLAVAIDPTDSGTWLVGRQIDGHLWRTVDSGAHWQTVLAPIGQDTMTGGRRSIHGVAFAPSDPRVVYAATGIAPNYVAHGVVGTGAYVSSDGGVTWAGSNRGLEGTKLNVMCLAVHPRDARTVYVGLLGDGVFRSVDGGGSWLPARQGLLATDIRALAINPLTPSTIYAGSERGGVWRSKDSGATWKQLSVGIPAEASVHGLAIDPVHSGVIYAADLTAGVYRTTDGGTTWTVMNNGLRMRAVNALAITPDGLHLYAATEGAGVFRLDLPETHVPRRHLRTK